MSVSVTPARGSPGPAATPLLPCVHVTPVFSSCGFCCISGTTGLAAGWGGPRRGPQRETGPAPPAPWSPSVSVRGCACSESHRMSSPVPRAESSRRGAHTSVLARLRSPSGLPARGPAAGPAVVSPRCPMNSEVSPEMSFFTVLLSGCSRWLRVFVWLVRARLPAPRGERSVLGFLLFRREAACRSPSRGGSLPIFPAARSLVFTVLAQCI